MPDYADGADLIARKDVRDLAELCSDNGADIDPDDVATHAYVIAALDDAEGEVVSSLLMGGRYSPAELSELTGTALNYLKRIICEIAICHMLRRRPSMRPDELEAYEKIHEQHLKRLATGQAIFGGNDDDIDASRVCVEGPTAAEWNDLNLLRDRSDYFPRRRYPVRR